MGDAIEWREIYQKQKRILVDCGFFHICQSIFRLSLLLLNIHQLENHRLNIFISLWFMVNRPAHKIQHYPLCFQLSKVNFQIKLLTFDSVSKMLIDSLPKSTKAVTIINNRNKLKVKSFTLFGLLNTKLLIFRLHYDRIQHCKCRKTSSKQ